MTMNIKILNLLLAFLFSTSCMSGSFKGESRGNTVKRYLHNCTYEIWDGFIENLRYRFNIVRDGGYIEIRLEELPRTDKLDNFIDSDISKHKAKLISLREDKYFFGEVHRKKIKIGNNSAIVMSYEFNERRKKGEKGFNDSLRRIENCYIKLKDKTLVLKGSTFSLEYNKSVKNLYEEFYKSFREDDSQKFRTNYGSFKWVDGLEDESKIEYAAIDNDRAVTMGIEIYYLNEAGKIDIKDRFPPPGVVRASSGFSEIVFRRNIKSEKLMVDGYEVNYNEFDVSLHPIKIREAEIWILDFTLGVRFKISEERPGYFNMYRNEINAMIKSFKFYPD